MPFGHDVFHRRWQKLKFINPPEAECVVHEARWRATWPYRNKTTRQLLGQPSNGWWFQALIYINEVSRFS